MKYTQEVTRKLKQIQSILQATEKLNLVLKELSAPHSPSSGKSVEFERAIILLRDIDD